MVQKFPLLEVVQACHSLLIPTEKRSSNYAPVENDINVNPSFP